MAPRKRTEEPRPMIVRPVFEKFFDLQPLNSNTVVSEPRHFGGFFKGSRLFGGHTATQSFLAAKRLRNGAQAYRIDINFFAPGNLHHDLVYQETSPATNPNYVNLDVWQNNILLSTASCRLHDSLPSDDLSDDSMNVVSSHSQKHFDFPHNVLEPETYTEILDLVDRLPMNKWQKEHGQSFNYRGCTPENQIFQVRPIDHMHYAGLSYETKPMLVWARLSPTLLDLPIRDPEAIPLLLSDLIIGHPIFVHFDQLQIRVTSSATLSHKVYFHEFNFDPRGYFLIELKVNRANTTALVCGRIFDEQKRLLVSIFQNHYYTLHKDDLQISRPSAKM
ncbi:hypothetical protein M3Y95_00658600 [Aphelenchoides besseyi]|nr:hypothetical protein M3Y95_00658600 [Aphelenchoides besseyi]